jgi:hypothetical protein
VTAPRYVHDCTDCVYLGEHEHYDLYVCKVRTLMAPIPTLIARFSSDGPDYTSMSMLVFPEHAELVASSMPQMSEAYRRALVALAKR